jgi:hypothetical protein
VSKYRLTADGSFSPEREASPANEPLKVSIALMLEAHQARGAVHEAARFPERTENVSLCKA